MYTKSMLYALRGLLLPALFVAIPAGAQVKFASQNTASVLPRHNSFPGNLPGYYTASAQDRLSNTRSLLFFSSLPMGEGGPAEENPSANKTREPSGLSGNNTIVAVAGKISFRSTSFTYPVGSGKDLGVSVYSANQLMPYVISLKEYAKKNGYDTSYAFFSNMGMLTNRKRFFVVDLVNMTIVSSGLVAQGRGQGGSRFDKQYSNEKDSRCTSLGRYSIARKYRGEYGMAYRMAGLDSSNSNAYRRNIVLHSMGCMPDTGENMPVCISEGCPAVSVGFLSSLSRIIDSRKKPVLLWIFDSNLEQPVIETKTAGPDTTYPDEKVNHQCSMHVVPRSLY